MNWTEHVDAYCERTGPGLLAEPFNAVSNVAFLLAALALWRMLRHVGRPVPASLLTLVVLVVAIGLGSTAFHTFATGWAGLTDVLPITAFLLFGLVCYLHWFWAVPWRFAWAAVPAFLLFAATVVTMATATFGPLPGGTGYLFPLALLLAGGLGLLARAPHPGRVLLSCAAIFAVSLLLRTVDGTVCPIFGVGTHFLWHLLNAVVLYGVGYAFGLRWAFPAGRAPEPRKGPATPSG
ncbi:membrane protein [Longimycelium tulufanense]|uniref:Membrane protein n=1 Tax=Longimycelium tulufanense TaxID=907463 RepID=A0A8J3C9Q6_9PSEU|nr:ceramidase domain-containing protein [Longimycelium tulufanense]GGM33178.1 membrane protein [Longimycelium tulufanense]